MSDELGGCACVFDAITGDEVSTCMYHQDIANKAKCLEIETEILRKSLSSMGAPDWLFEKISQEAKNLVGVLSEEESDDDLREKK